MKKIIITAGVLLSMVHAKAQEFDPNDAVQFSSPQLNGSARFNAMGGAFGAIGGDISGIQINPAGSAVSIFNMATVTGSLNVKNNQANYLESPSKITTTDFNFNNVGAIFNFETKAQDRLLKKTTFSIAVTTDNNLNNEFYSKGINQNSVANYFLQHANYGFNGNAVPYDLVELRQGETITDLYDHLNGIPNGFSAQQAMLGYQSFILEKGNSGNYISNMAEGPYLQQSSVIQDGINAKVTGNIAFDFNNRFYVGANLNYHTLDFKKSNQLYESTTNTAITNGVSDILFTNNSYTYGGGFSFSIGALAKITESLRVGASYESPTWYNLNDEFEQRLETAHFSAGNQQFTDASPYIITIYDDYKLKTPAVFNGSLAYVFGTSGLISIDYSRKDYSSITYSGNSDYDAINRFYTANLKASNEIRVGSEYRIKQLSLRAGYRYVESPYENTRLIGDLNSISGGIGFTFDNKRLDLSYTYSQQPFEMAYISSGLNDVASLKAKNHIVALSYNVYF